MQYASGMLKTPLSKLEANRQWRKKNREKVKEINRNYRYQNKEKRNADARQYRADNPERRAATDRAYYVLYKRQRRRDILEKLGGKCIRCGFDDYRALQIDHVNNGGEKHRKSFTSPWKYYKHISENIESGEFQILCANCNQIKRYEEVGGF